jgi:hypothetical protein
MDKLALRVLITLIITWMYCNIWMILEKIIDGQVTNRLVDNIIMLLFIPIIYLATKTIVK